MRWSLRAKLAASHSLPILLLMPVLSLYLLYSLEGFLTQRLVRQLTYQAQLVWPTRMIPHFGRDLLLGDESRLREGKLRVSDGPRAERLGHGVSTECAVYACLVPANPRANRIA